MVKLLRYFLAIGFIICFGASHAVADDANFSNRFDKGSQSFGLQVGLGYTEDLPLGEDRTDITYLFFFPNFQYNLTGMMGSSWYQGTLNWPPF
jgi:hypothetical protein